MNLSTSIIIWFAAIGAALSCLGLVLALLGRRRADSFFLEGLSAARAAPLD